MKRVQDCQVAFCGIVRDCARNLAGNLETLEKLGGEFQSYQIVLVENDSKDGTKEVLRKFAEKNSRLVYECEDFNTLTIPKLSRTRINPSFSRHRIEKMARYRNRSLELLEDKVGLEQLDYVVIIDLDVRSFDTGAFLAAFNQSDQWDVLTSNGRGRTGFFGEVYYDAFAFWKKGAEGPCTTKTIFSSRDYLAEHLKEGELFEAESAFNGLAIYRAGLLEGARYRAEANDDPVVETWCEHVTLHRDLARRQPFRLVIDPALRVEYNTRLQALVGILRFYWSHLREAIKRLQGK